MDINESSRSKFLTQERVLQLLKNKFFKPCKCPHPYACNLCCYDCMGTPFCKSCKPTHEGHRILQIRKTSHRDSIHKVDLKNLLDLSGIPPVTINRKEAVYLKSNKNQQHKGKVGKVGKVESGGRNSCKYCNAKLPEGNYRFCSVLCKSFKLFLSNVHVPEEIENEDENGRSSNDNIIETDGSITAGRNTHRPLSRKRKGVPKRSPFF